MQGLKPVLVAGRNSDESDSDDEDVFDPDAVVDDRTRGSVAKKRDFATAPF
jgi:hypothetical protein